jgi:transposase
MRLLGELTERRLGHQMKVADAFYLNLQSPVRVGSEATGPILWFERLLAELGPELWIGDASKIRASQVRKQNTDDRDARLILELLLTKRFLESGFPHPPNATCGSCSGIVISSFASARC